MGAWGLKHRAQLEEWKQRVIECRSSGQTVAKWCREHEIVVKTYYRWEREVVDLAVLQMPEREQQSGLVPVGRHRFAELALPTERESDQPGNLLARLKAGTTEVEIYNGASTEIVSALCQVLKDAP